MDEETKGLIDRANAILAKASPGPWASRPSCDRYGDNCEDVIAYSDKEQTIAGEIENDGFDNAAFIAESRQLVPALRDALLKLDAERQAERAVWTEYIASLKGCVECTECPCETCTERTNRAKSQMYDLGLPIL